MFDKLRADVEFMRGNHETALEMFLEGARDGSEIAAFNYAYCSLYGFGKDPDPSEAKSFFSFAKNMEGGEACYNLAMLYLHGNGVKCNYKLSFEYMRDSARLGCLEAMLYLGMAYTTGCMFEPDVIGISLIPSHTPIYRDPNAPLLVGYVPDMEDDEDKRYSVVSPDARQAFLWFRAAARQDPTYAKELVEKAQFLYAKCYIDGLGVEIDRQKGMVLMLKAGRDGSRDAVSYLGEQGITEKSLLGRGKRKPY